LSLVREQSREAYSAGLTLNAWSPQTLSIGNVLNGSAGEDAGLQPGDQILTINGKKVTSRNWLSRFNRYQQGDRVPISFKRDRRTLQTTLVLGAPDLFEYRIAEKKDATAAQKALRAEWLKGR